MAPYALLAPPQDTRHIDQTSTVPGHSAPVDGGTPHTMRRAGRRGPFARLAAVLVAALVVVSCGGEGAVTGPQEASPSPSDLTLSVEPDLVEGWRGDSSRFQAVVRDGDGNTVDAGTITWSSGDTSVAKVSDDGSVTFGKGGSVTITATASLSSSDTELTSASTAKSKGGKPSSIEITPSSPSLAVGDSVALDATVRDASGKTKSMTVKWVSADEAVVTVSDAGVVTGRATGAAHVQAEAGPASDSIEVTVGSSNVADVEVTPGQAETVEGDSLQLDAAVMDSTGSELNRTPSWQSSDTTVAVVNGSGLVRARRQGTADIRAEAGGEADTTHVTVSSTSSPPSMPQTVSVAEAGRTDTSVTYDASWGSSDGADSYAWNAGSNSGAWARSGSETTTSTRFTAPRSDTDDDSFFCVEGVSTDGTSEASCTGFVMPAEPTSGGTVANVEVSPSSTQVDVGASVDLDATARDGSGDPVSASFSWSSSNTSVATVDGSGRVTGQAEGAAEITATADGVSDAATVDVVTATSPPSGDIPTPDSNDRVVFDTRAGGSHDLQAMTTEAEVEAIFQNPTPHPDGGWGLTTDFDGNGTHAIRLEWPRASNSDVGRLLIVDDLGSSDPSELYMQYKVWMGRTETGGGIGDIGAFDFTNDNEAGAARKILRAFTNPWSGSDQPFQSFNFHGSDPYTTTLSVCAGGASQCGGNPSWHVGSWRSPGDLENRATTFTMYVKHESSQGAGDGEFGIWIDGDRILYETGLTLGGHSINRWQFPMIIRSPVQDQTEYIWDVVAWDPQ